MNHSKDPYTRWAWAVIEAYVCDRRRLEIAQSLPSDIREKPAACFVSLHTLDGHLRGCIGTIFPVQASLAEEIRENAISSATADPRFMPVQCHELDNLRLSVDVLGPPCQVHDTGKLNPKVYGVIVESGHRKGVLLPDLEGVETIEQQLSIARKKAGIPDGASVNIFRFSVRRYHSEE